MHIQGKAQASLVGSAHPIHELPRLASGLPRWLRAMPVSSDQLVVLGVFVEATQERPCGAGDEGGRATGASEGLDRARRVLEDLVASFDEADAGEPAH